MTGARCYVDASADTTLEVVLFHQPFGGIRCEYGLDSLCEYSLDSLSLAHPVHLECDRAIAFLEVTHFEAWGTDVSARGWMWRGIPEIYNLHLFQDELNLISSHLDEPEFCSIVLLECVGKFLRLLPRLLEPVENLERLESDLHQILESF